MAKDFRSTLNKQMSTIKTSMKDQQKDVKNYTDKKNEADTKYTPAGMGLGPLPRNTLLQCYVPKSVKDQIQKYAKEEELSTNDFMNLLICAYIDHREGKQF